MKTPQKEFTIEPERNSLKLTVWNGQRVGKLYNIVGIVEEG